MSITYEIELLSGPTPAKLKGEFSIMHCAVMRSLNQLPRASITLLEGKTHIGAFDVSIDKQFLVGNILTINITNTGEKPMPLFVGIIEKQILIEDYSGSKVQLELCHAAIRMTKQSNTRVFPAKSSVFSVIDKLQKDWSGDGVKPKLEFLASDLPKTAAQNLVQYQADDLKYMFWLASSYGRVVAFEEKGISIKLPEIVKPAKTIISHQEDSILSYEIKVDGSQFIAAASSIDLNIKAEKSESKKAPAKPSAINAKDYYDPLLAKRMGSTQLDYMQPIPGEEAEAKNHIDGGLIRSDLSLIQGEIKIVGNNKLLALIPGQSIELVKFGKLDKKLVFVSSVRHQFGAQGWMVTLQFGLGADWYHEQRNLMPKPAQGLLPPISGLHLAEVVDTKEVPDDDGRILVQILNQNEPKVGAAATPKSTFLARVSSFYAGKAMGAWFRPEKNDLVLLGFLNDDPRHPVILGSLYRDLKNIPELLKSDPENKMKGLIFDKDLGMTYDTVDKVMTLSTTLNGKDQNIVLDQKKKEIRIEHAEKHTINITEKGIEIKTAGDFKVEADGNINLTAKKNIAIKGKEINLLN